MRIDAKEVQAEQAVIGALLIDDGCHGFVFGSLRVDDFADGRNKELFRSARELWENQDVADVVTIIDNAQKDGFNDDLTQYALDVMELTPTAANVKAYVQIVKKNAKLRAIGALADDITNATFYNDSPNEILALVENQIAEIGAEQEDSVISSADALQKWNKWTELQAENPEHVLVRTGYKTLDDQLGGGFFRTGFYVIGGRPGMGKTTMALNIAERIANQGKRVLFLSLEMGIEEITAKRLAILSGIGYSRLHTARLTEVDRAALKPAQNKMLNAKFDVVADGISSTQDLSTLVRTHKDIDIVFVDYMGIMEPAEEDKQKPIREQVTNISKHLKAIAKKNRTPVVALSQLNRNSLTNSDKRPSLADLRDTGAIEQDADGVILVHRPGYFDAEAPQDDIELIVAKNRHDAVGTVLMKWVAESGQVLETVHEFQAERSAPPPQKSHAKPAPPQNQYADINGADDLPF